MAGKKAGRQSIFKQLLALGVVLMLVLMAAFAITNIQMRSLRQKNILALNEQNMAQISDEVDSYRELMTQIATVTAYSPTMYTYFSQNSIERLILTDDINTVFSNTILLEDNIAGICVFDRQMEMIASMGNGAQDEGTPEVVKTRKEQQEYSSLFYLSDSRTPYFAFYFPVFNLNSQVYGEQIGMCVFIMEMGKLEEALRGQQATRHTQLYIVDGMNQVMAVLGGDDMEELEPQLMRTTADYLVESRELPVGGWQLVSRIPRNELYQGADGSLGFYTAAYLLALAILLCMILFCYRRLVLPIRNMDSFVREVQKEPGVRMQVGRQDEIGTVELGLNRMLDSIEEKNMQIQEAREKAYQMENAEKQLQILAYRNQINPHFLYNTLDCIRGMALYHEEEEIAEITLALSRLFRFAVKGGNVVKVEEEVCHIQDYAHIIDHRFHGRIQVRTEVAEDVKEKHVIKFLLQPLIENAVFHGLEGKVEGGWVRASIRMEGERKLCCVVEDNGCGIETEKLAALRRGMESRESQNGIGMSNIYQRLKLFYGEEAFFEIESERNAGTKVIIVIPERPEEGMITDA